MYLSGFRSNFNTQILELRGATPQHDIWTGGPGCPQLFTPRVDQSAMQLGMVRRRPAACTSRPQDPPENMSEGHLPEVVAETLDVMTRLLVSAWFSTWPDFARVLGLFSWVLQCSRYWSVAWVLMRCPGYFMVAHTSCCLRETVWQTMSPSWISGLFWDTWEMRWC